MSSDQQQSTNTPFPDGDRASMRHLQLGSEHTSMPSSTANNPFPYGFDANQSNSPAFIYTSTPSSQPSSGTPSSSFRYNPSQVSNYPTVSQGSTFLQHSPVHTHSPGNFPYRQSLGYSLPYTPQSPFPHLSQSFTPPGHRISPHSRQQTSPFLDPGPAMQPSLTPPSLPSPYASYNPVSPQDYRGHSASPYSYEPEVSALFGAMFMPKTDVFR